MLAQPHHQPAQNEVPVSYRNGVVVASSGIVGDGGRIFLLDLGSTPNFGVMRSQTGITGEPFQLLPVTGNT